MPPDLLLNTRPEPQASRFAQRLVARFGARLQVMSAPLMQAEFLPVTLPQGPFAALVLTSETGAQAADRLLMAGKALPGLAFCVGDRTAEVAFSAGLETVSAGGDAGDLLRLIERRPEDPLLYLHGEDRAADLGAALAGQGRRVTSLAVYRQRALPLSEAARQLLASRAPLILPLFSPRSADLFLAAAAGLPLDHIRPVVISENAHARLPPVLAEKAVLAAAPDGPAMEEAIARCLTLTAG